MKRLLLLLIPLSMLVGCDHATKMMAKAHLEDQPSITVVDGLLDLRYTENRDVGFSLLRFVPDEVRTPLIYLLNGVALVLAGLLTWRHRATGRKWLPAGFMLLAAGAIGNNSDRMLHGYVTDFIHLPYWPVFNVADICIVAGVACFLIGMMRIRSHA
jgi:signal peptidase II